MLKVSEIIDRIKAGNEDNTLLGIYIEKKLKQQKKRYIRLLEKHIDLFGNREVMIISTPGRTELGGNHTDHNHGNVLAGSVDLDSVCVVSAAEGDQAAFFSAGWSPVKFDVTDTRPRAEEKDSTEALLRGITARFRALGYGVGGFNLNMDSEVLPGSGLSSSASVEVLIGTALNEMFNGGRIGFVEIAQIGQWAENNYFGKACGLMDQVACAAGGVVGIDFMDPIRPEITPVKYSFDERGYELMVVAVGSSHANLSDEYSAMPKEMRSIASHFGKEVCRGISLDELVNEIPALRRESGDRAVLRAYHFLLENERAVNQLRALADDNLDNYLRLVNESGNSSFKYLQNIYLGHEPENQGLSIALAFTESFLDGEGACRVQGGGFAGTIQAYIPKTRVKEYIVFMEKIFGKGCAEELRIRNKPACRIL